MIEEVGLAPYSVKRYRPPLNVIVVDLVQDPLPIGDVSGKIILPDTVDRANTHKRYSSPICRVVAVGPDVKHVQEGDFILIPIAIARQAVAINYDGDELYIINETNVAGIIEGEPVLTKPLKGPPCQPSPVSA